MPAAVAVTLCMPSGAGAGAAHLGAEAKDGDAVEVVRRVHGLQLLANLRLHMRLLSARVNEGRMLSRLSMQRNASARDTALQSIVCAHDVR